VASKVLATDIAGDWHMHLKTMYIRDEDPGHIIRDATMQK
jgi:hypothetical protein